MNPFSLIFLWVNDFDSSPFYSLLQCSVIYYCQDGRLETVMLTGIGDDQSPICQNWARQRDSWIFFASHHHTHDNFNNENTFQLNSSLVRMTLNNIDNVDAAVLRYGQSVVCLSVAQSEKIHVVLIVETLLYSFCCYENDIRPSVCLKLLWIL